MSIERNKNDEQKGAQTVKGSILGMIIFAGVVIIVIFALCLFIISQIITPLLKVMGIAEKVVQGDFTADKVAVSSQDEMGKLAEVFNKLIDSLHDAFSQVRSFADKVATSAQQLASSTEEMNASTQEVSNAIQQVAKGASPRPKG